MEARDSVPDQQGRDNPTSKRTTETPHDYTIREAELCLSAVLHVLATAGIYILVYGDTKSGAFYEVRHNASSGERTYYDELHHAYEAALAILRQRGGGGAS